MTDQLISYETALMAKEKGFDVPVKYFYDIETRKVKESKTFSLFDYNLVPVEGHDNCFCPKENTICSAPTQSLLQRWLREVHKKVVNINHIPHNQRFCFRITGQYSEDDHGILVYNSYEDALESGLQQALKTPIMKNQLSLINDHLKDDGVPRRSILDKMSDAERAILKASQAVEELLPDVRLTHALQLLNEARNKVADFVDEMFEPRPSYSPEELAPNDPVNHPSHYTDGKIEVIDFIIDKNLPYCLGNVVKYISRAGKKDPTKQLEDLRKAAWYLNHHIEIEQQKIKDE